MAIEERVSRGANQALFSFLPGQLEEYPGANAVVLVKSWASKESAIASKKRILDKIYHAAIERRSRYKDVDRAFPKKPDINMFYFGEPHIIMCELFPLVFTEQATNRAYIFRDVTGLNSFLNKWGGGKLMQRDLVFLSKDGEGEMDQLQPIVDIRTRHLKLEKQGDRASQAALRWVDADTGEVLGRVYGILSGKRVNEGTPARAKRTFQPQLMNLVNIRDYIDADEPEKETLGALILARYIYGSAGEMSLYQAFEKVRKTKGLTAEKTARKYAEALGVNFDDLAKEKKREMLAIESTEMEKVKMDMSDVRSTFSKNEILNSLDEVYEYVETADSEGKITLQGLLGEGGSEAKKAMYRQFIGKLNDIGVSSATYLADVPLVNLAYGFVRGEYDTLKTLKPFPIDEFDKTRSKIPIYLTQNKSEGLLLGIDRRKIIDFLVERGTVKDPPKLGKEKEWFIKNVDPTKISRFSGVQDEGITKDVFGIIHTISHALMKQIPEQCGIGINQIGEALFPSIPAILIFSMERGEFRLGALKDLFENKIYPWVDISFRASRSGSCVYDPVCFHGSGACHSCLFLNEISCGYFNQGLSRHVLFGSVRKKTKGFWDGSLKKF